MISGPWGGLSLLVENMLQKHGALRSGRSSALQVIDYPAPELGPELGAHRASAVEEVGVGRLFPTRPSFASCGFHLNATPDVLEDAPKLQTFDRSLGGADVRQRSFGDRLVRNGQLAGGIVQVMQDCTKDVDVGALDGEGAAVGRITVLFLQKGRCLDEGILERPAERRRPVTNALVWVGA